MLAPITTHAQLDSIAKARAAARRALNTTKLELQYEKVTKTMTSSRGMQSQYTVTYQLLSINDKPPVEIDKRGEILRRYFNRCWEARDLLDQGNAYLKKGNRFKWGGLAAGTAIMFTGLFANPEMKEGRMALGFGLGLGAILTGAGYWMNNRNFAGLLSAKSFSIQPANGCSRSILKTRPTPK